MDRSTILGCSLIVGAGRTLAQELEGQEGCLGLGTVPPQLGYGIIPIRSSFVSGLEALFDMQLNTGRERGEEWEEALCKRLH